MATAKQKGFDHGLKLAENATNTWIASRIQDLVTDIEVCLREDDKELLDFTLGEIVGLAQGIKLI